jgi:FixJ family two-component response regulator
VLLTDVVMPQMPGKQLAARVRDSHPEVGVVFMSGYTKALLLAQGVLEPGDHLVEKPFDRAELLGKVSEVLGLAGEPEPAAHGRRAPASAARPEPTASAAQCERGDDIG